MKPDYRVLIYIPNLIGYVRLILIVLTLCLIETNPLHVILLYSLSAALDGIDGIAARQLGQCSAFGAWFDVIVDNVGRSVLWSHYKYGSFVSCVEWVTFVCNHCRGSGWKNTIEKDLSSKVPYHVQKVMANGFKSPAGITAISGLHVLPIWLFMMDCDIFTKYLSFIPTSVTTTGLVFLICGRVLCLSVELWCIWAHVKCLLAEKSVLSSEKK